MKIKIILKENNEQTENFVMQNANFVKFAMLSSELTKNYIFDNKFSSLVRLFLKESLLIKNKIKKRLGIGGYHIVFQLSNNMILKLYYQMGSSTRWQSPGAQYFFDKQITQNNQEYEEQQKKPDVMVIYSKGNNESWAYIITNKVSVKQTKPKKAGLSPSGHQLYGQSEESLLPKDIVTALESELNVYQDTEGNAMARSGDSWIYRNDELSSAQKIVRNPQIKFREKVSSLYKYFYENYWQFRELELDEKKMVKDILSLYIKHSLKGKTDFKFSNIGLTSSGQIAWFDKQDIERDPDVGAAVINTDFLQFPNPQPHKQSNVSLPQQSNVSQRSAIQSVPTNISNHEERYNHEERNEVDGEAVTRVVNEILSIIMKKTITQPKLIQKA